MAAYEEYMQDQVDQPVAVEQTEQIADQFADSNQANGHLTGQALKAYGRQMNHQKNEDELILQFLPLVHRIVSQVASYLKPPLSREDLVSAGTIGLVKAARDFDPSKDAEFKTYAYIRVRGAVIDELRGWSFAPPAIKKLIDQARDISERAVNESGRPPSDDELASEMGIDSDKMYQVFETARARHFLSINGMDEESPALGQFLASDSKSPDSSMEQGELKKHLVEAIQELPEKHRQIILLYYHRQLTMKQISEVMDVTESRISQLHAAALFKLSVHMKQWDDTEES